ncbi:MAG: tripartite tricarboxylate transporter substrate binding protein [Burkholderiales bacterium]|nr:MAG: tripartite tricarboxylate transporter substrate binding protein [Burkholderiales bacterium]
MKLSSRRQALTFLGASALVTAFPARSQDAARYPERPIRLVIPTSPGGTMDAMARLIAEHLSASWKQPVLVDNRPGGNGAIAYSMVSKGQADGYTVLLSISSLVQTALLSKTPTYSIQEFTPLAVVAMLPNAFAVGKHVPANTVQQFIEWAKSQKRGVDYGTSGPGSSGNIMGGTLAQASGIDLVHIAFKGEAPAIQAVMGGQIAAVFGSTGSLVTQARAGNLKVLAVALPNRLKDYPDVPTFSEAGFPAVNLPGWSMAAVPAATPKPIVDRLSAEITRIVQLPEVSARINSFGFQPEGGTPEAARRFLHEELTRWGAAIKAANITPE